jgi:hypothetical protein
VVVSGSGLFLEVSSGVAAAPAPIAATTEKDSATEEVPDNEALAILHSVSCVISECSAVYIGAKRQVLNR